MDMAILLHDGLCCDLPDIDLPCPLFMILPDAGALRVARFQAFFYASAFSQSDGVPPPAPARVPITAVVKGPSKIIFYMCQIEAPEPRG